MNWILPVLAVFCTIFGLVLTAYLTFNFREKAINGQETIKELNKEIDKSIKKVSEINEEILKVSEHSDKLTGEIKKAQEKIGVLTNEIAEISKANLDYTVGNEEPFIIGFLYDEVNNAFQVYASPKGELPVYDVEIILTYVNITANKFVEALDKERKNGKGFQIGGEMIRSFPKTNFSKKILLPNKYNFIGWLVNRDDKNWKHLNLEVTTRTKKFEQRTFLYYTINPVSPDENPYYWCMRARVNGEDSTIEHDTFEITEDLITEMEGERYWTTYGSFWGEQRKDQK